VGPLVSSPMATTIPHLALFVRDAPIPDRMADFATSWSPSRRLSSPSIPSHPIPSHSFLRPALIVVDSFEYVSLISLHDLSHPLSSLSLAFNLADPHLRPLPLPSTRQILDSTTELDQILFAQHVAANGRCVRSPSSEQSTPSSPEPLT
jgi:hypothetical protein